MSAAASVSRQRLSWDEYAALGECVRAEYIDGYAVVTPSPTREHQVACARVIRLLEAALPVGYEVIGAWSWKPDDNEFVPDVMVHPTSYDDRPKSPVRNGWMSIVAFFVQPPGVAYALSTTKVSTLPLRAHHRSCVVYDTCVTLSLLIEFSRV